MVEFYNNGAIKLKVYPFNYTVRSEIRQPIIVIIHDNYTFFANNRVQKV